MIVLPAAVGLGLALGLALLAIKNMGREAENIRRAAEDDYKRQGQNWGSFILAIIVAAVLLGAVGVGPLAGLVMIETLR